MLAGLVAATFQAGAQTRAIVDFSVATLHREASYTSPVESQCLMGSMVLVTGSESYWRRVEAEDPAYPGWTEELGIVEMTDAEFEAYEAAPKYVCTSQMSHIWSEPSEKSLYVGEITMGGVVRKVLKAGGKPVKKGRFVKVMMPSGKCGWIPASCLEDFESWKAAARPDADSIISTAYMFLGLPYIWGGNSTKGVDCSGLTWMAFHMNGMGLPRDAFKQALKGVEVPEEEMRRGDLIFFGTPADGDKPESVSHVAIYLGDGMIIHSSQVVRISSLDPSSPDFYSHKPILHIKRFTH